MSYEVEGQIVARMETQRISDNFQKREFVVKTTNQVGDKEYNEYIKFQTVNDKTSLLDSVNKDDQVKVSFNLRGRKYEKDGKTMFFNSLDAWRIDIGSKELDQFEQTANKVADKIDSDLPF